jgi:hypothetical protein
MSRDAAAERCGVAANYGNKMGPDLNISLDEMNFVPFNRIEDALSHIRE